jgi:hypothetical protein
MILVYHSTRKCPMHNKLLLYIGKHKLKCRKCAHTEYTDMSNINFVT